MSDATLELMYALSGSLVQLIQIGEQENLPIYVGQNFLKPFVISAYVIQCIHEYIRFEMSISSRNFVPSSTVDARYR